VIELQPDLELLPAQAERLLEAWLGDPVACLEIGRLEGGMVNTVLRLDFDRPPHRAVVKLRRPDGDAFAAEARSLEYLRSETACPVPTVYLKDSSARLIPYAFLLLEHLPGVCLKGLDLEPAVRADVDAQLAEVLAELHEHRGAGWGAVASGDGSGEWADLFTARLLEARAHPPVAVRLAPDVLASVDEAIKLAPSALRDAGAPTLVHGDVWDGNMVVRRADGHWRLTGLLDPDLQFADVEFELAYLEVFDGPRESFFAAYTKHQALRPGYEERRLFYWLHTALVHVALFGDEFFCNYTARIAETIVRVGRGDESP
jgi:fructosamine-3-kinase